MTPQPRLEAQRLAAKRGDLRCRQRDTIRAGGKGPMPLAQPARPYLVIAALPLGVLAAIGRQHLSLRSHPTRETRP